MSAPSTAEINAQAEFVIQRLIDGRSVAVPIPDGLSANERASLIDYQHAVAHAVAWRGWRIRSGVRGSAYVIQLERQAG